MEDFLPSDKEKKLAIEGTIAVLEFAYAVYLTSWVAGFLGIYFLYQTYKSMKIPGEIRLKRMVAPSVVTATAFVLIFSLIHFILGSLDG